MVWNLVILACWLTAIASADDDLYRPEMEKKLLNDLLQTYHRGVAPTHEGAVNVSIGFSLLNFDFIDEANEQATLHAYVFENWNDSRLKWDPNEYSNTTSIRIEARNIWRPDIEIYNSGSVNGIVSADVIANSNGLITYVPSIQITFLCRMDFRFFPYDEQKCELQIGSWHHSSETIDLTSSSFASWSHYSHSKDFELADLTVKRHVMVYDCCPGKEWISLTYTFDLKRSSNAYSTKLVLPSVLTGFLVLATFLLPPASSEKITLCGFLFLSLLLLLTYLHDIVPSSGDTILGEFLAFALFIDFFATILAVVSYNVNVRSSPVQTRSEAIFAVEGDDNDLKIQMPKDRKREWLRYLDLVCFILFSIVFIVGLAIILGRRG